MLPIGVRLGWRPVLPTGVGVAVRDGAGVAVGTGVGVGVRVGVGLGVGLGVGVGVGAGVIAGWPPSTRRNTRLARGLSVQPQTPCGQ